MSTYRKIHGRSIQAVTTDPTESVAEGQVWYNTSSDTFKSVVSLEAFSSASPLSTTREGAGAFGTQTTAVICGGETPSVSGATEEYNGTGFSAGGTMNTARYRLQGTAGTATAGIIFGGVEPATSNKTETYNGTAWTTSPYTLNTARWCAGAGVQTSALAFGGGPGYKNESEEFDGEGWTAVNTLNTSRNSLSGAGANAEECLAFGGETSSPPSVATNATESWDGTSWTEVNNLNTARYGGYGAGTQSAAFLAGGIVGPGTMQSAAETWDGTNWTSSPASLATARGRLSVAGSSTAAIAMAGQTPGITTAAEEFNRSANVITAAAWSAGGALPTTVYGNAGTGNTPAGFSIGGGTGPVPSYVSTSNTYDGTSWTGAPSVPFSFSLGGGAGPQTASIAGGGDGNAPGAMAIYNGSSWTATPTIGTNAYQMKFVGNSSAAFGTGAYPTSNSYIWNGSSWTSSPAAPTHFYNHSAVGSPTSAYFLGGSIVGPGSSINTTTIWNGSAWSTGTAMPVSGGTGGQSANTAPTDNFWINGFPPARITTITWDGTAWTTFANTANPRSNAGGAGTSSTSGFLCGGTPPITTATEEISAETTALNVKTLTQS
jgi:hypothetical protein